LIATYLILVVRRSGDPGVVIFACTLFFVVGIVLFIRGFHLLKRRRLILDTPFSKIRGASIGMVEISGQAVGPYTMNAPITAHPCYFYRTLVWELKKEGKNSQWVKVAGECMHLPFFVDDNTGRVMIDPRGADLDLHCDFQQEFSTSFFSTKDAPPPEVAAFLARYGVSTTNKIKVEEFCIKPKNALFVLGTLGENPGVEVTSRPIQEIERLGPSRRGFLLALNPVLSPSSSSVENDIDAHAFAEQFPTTSSSGSGRFSSSQSSLSPSHFSQSRRQEVIQLSTDPTPVKTEDMTQQQKVAAALLKAGIANPVAWSAAGLSIPTFGGTKAIPDPSANFAGYAANGNGGNGNSGANTPRAQGNGSNGSGFKVQNAGAKSVGLNGNEDDLPRPQNPSEGFVLRPPVVIRKGDNNPTFLISWRSQQEVVRTLRWQCTLMIWGGPAISLLSLYFMLNVLHLI
jgi:hypothetical protein